MEKQLKRKLTADELDQVVGGKGFVYWVRDNDKFHVVTANRALSRDEILKVWNSNGMTTLAQKDKKGNAISGTVQFNVYKGLDSSRVEHLRGSLERKYGKCQYIEFK